MNHKKIAGLLLCASLALLVACGGGSTATPAPMIDSFGQVVPDSFGGGNAGASGADGTAADGVAIPNATVRVIDNAGQSVSGKTDANGYYRVRVDGFVAPLIASVVRPDGSQWYSPAITPVKVRGFVTINMTGLTDRIASYVAIATGKSSSAELTAAALAANLSILQTARNDLNARIATQITAAGLNAATFDPVTLPFVANGTGYDAVLDNVLVTKTPLGATELTPLYTVGGNISGLGNHAGLVLSNGTDSLNVAANATTFTLAKRLPTGVGYSVTVSTQPSGTNCTVSSGTGLIGSSPVTNVQVVCDPGTASHTLGGVVSGLGNFSGLVLASNGQTVAVPASASSFTFANPIPEGTSYAVSIQTQPDSSNCSISGGSGTVGTSAITSVMVTCSTASYPLGGTVSGLTSSGLVLASNGQTVSVSSGAASFVFGTPLSLSTSYAVTVQTQPAGMTCSVSNGSGSVSGPVNSISVTCGGQPTFFLGGIVVGGSLVRPYIDGLVLASGAQTAVIDTLQAGLHPGRYEFRFPIAMTSGTPYSVYVLTQPPGYICSVSNGTGSLANADVFSVSVNCVAIPTYTLGGRILGAYVVSGQQAVLASNGQTVTIGPAPGCSLFSQSCEMSFTFPTPLPSGTQYSVSIVDMLPAAFNCGVSNGTGTISSADVTNIEISCRYRP